MIGSLFNLVTSSENISEAREDCKGVKDGEKKKHVLLTYPSAHSSLTCSLSASFLPWLNVSHLQVQEIEGQMSIPSFLQIMFVCTI